jgi:hypothetical protein
MRGKQTEVAAYCAGFAECEGREGFWRGGGLGAGEEGDGVEVVGQT